MKAIINGLRYDTEKGFAVGSYDNGLPSNDFQSWSATLYKTPRSGRFFLAGEGGAMTQFATRHGGNSGWGEKIIPMSKEEALEWAEEYLEPAEIEEHFADAIQEA